MKFRNSSALALAVALGFASVGAAVLSAPAVAASPKPPKLSEGVRNALAAAQKAIEAKDAATAVAKAAEAKAAVVTPVDKFWSGNIQLQAGQLAKDSRVQLEGVEAMIDSGLADAATLPRLRMAMGQFAYQLEDYAKAEAVFDLALKEAPAPEAYVLAAETKYKLRKAPEAARLMADVAEKGQASGTPVPEDWIKRGIAFGVQGKSAAETMRLSKVWLAAYPKQVNWRDSLEIYRMLNTVDGDYSLDLMRLQRAAGALRGERDYAELAEATYIKFPNEAKSVLDQGIAAGVIDPAKSRAIKDLRGIAAGKVAADKASLSKSVATGRAALATADAYAGYGDHASAIELYRKALSLGGVDAQIVNTRLAAALMQSGQKDAAKSVLASVTGPRRDLATYWSLLIDHPPVAN